MKTKCHIFTAVALCALFLDVQSGFAQGSLTPPGPPGPTMKSLDQIEPRIPISSLPYALTNFGSYYLTANLQASSAADGITIGTNNVTLDLNGYTMTGFGTGNSAIYVSPSVAVENVTIRNGIIRGWGAGVNMATVTAAHLDHLTVADNPANFGLHVSDNCEISDCIVRSNAAGLYTGANCSIKNCLAVRNNGLGIFLGNNGVMSDCISQSNSADGLDLGNDCTLTDCRSSGNTISGVNAGLSCIFTGCSITANGSVGVVSGNNGLFRNCKSVSNTNDGFEPAEGSTFNSCISSMNSGNGYNSGPQCVFTDCTANGNVNHGFYPDDGCVLRNCVANYSTSGNGINAGFTAVIIEGCNALGNALGGIVAGTACQIKDCVAQGNSSTGISAGSGSVVMNCVSQGGGADGIYVGGSCLVMNNASSGNAGYGIHAEDSHNKIDANIANNNTKPGIFSQTNSFDLIVCNYASLNDKSAATGTNFNYADYQVLNTGNFPFITQAGVNDAKTAAAGTATNSFQNF